MMSELVVWLLLMTLAACGGDSASVDSGTTPDTPAADSSTMDVVDGGTDALDASDGAAADTNPDGGTRVGTRLVLTDGNSLIGEVIVEYDHSEFWMEPAERSTVALFQADRFAPFPDDRSLTFIDAAEILREEAASLTAPTFQSFMREQGFVLERPPLLGIQFVITGAESYHLLEDGFGHFAIDIVLLGDDGLTYQNLGSENDDYWVWNAEVFSPVAGTVVDVVSDAVDQRPGPMDLAATNNWVGIHLGGGYYLYLLHFRQDSIAVTVGQEIEAGELLGRVGNSGVSEAPHLHMTILAVDPESEPQRSWSMPVEWKDLHSSRLGPYSSTQREYQSVVGGTWIAGSAF